MVRSTSVPIAERSVPRIRSPSQWPGTARSAASAGRSQTKLRFTEVSGKSGNVGSVEAIFEPLGLDEALDGFMRRQVYGGHGDGFRHGTARDGWRRRSRG